jgi:2,4-dienoyl-CoA reductase-like NADH-dependent reductase (Old Yellow Enzyme family)/thioredoxin reductase
VPASKMNLLKAIRIKKMELKNRMVLPPMGTLFGTPGSGTVSERLKGYIEARAKGGVGLIIVEYTAVSPSGRASIRQLGIWSDRFIQGLSELAEIAHHYSSKICIQLHHAGREADANLCNSKPVAPSPLAGASGMIPKELSLIEIKNLIDSFAEGAGRAKDAGFDCIEIHGAHGYLVSQFMTPIANHRKDQYGMGSAGGLSTFPVDIVKAVRQRVGSDYPILFRISGDEHISGGRSLPESIAITKKLVDAGVDMIDVSAGLLQSGEWIIPSNEAMSGLHVQAAAAIRKAVGVPVIAVGKIHKPELAEEIISAGKADLVALGRALLVDPEFPNKVTEGRFDEIRYCVHCLQGCYNDPVLCTQNPELGHEWTKRIRPAEVMKKVFVVGSGPAGLEAARIAALRGYKVSVYEKNSCFGGQVNLAVLPPYKSDLKDVIDNRLKELKSLQVKLELGIEFTIDIVEKYKPDVVVIATGGSPLKPQIKGLDSANTFFAWDVLEGRVVLDKNILIIGAGSVGAETADYLLSKGKNLFLVDFISEIAADVPYANRVALLKRLKGSIEILLSTEIVDINGDNILVRVNGKKKVLKGIDQIVLATGIKPVNELFQLISQEFPEIELYIIGDARKPRSIIDALAEGNQVGHSI